MIVAMAEQRPGSPEVTDQGSSTTGQDGPEHGKGRGRATAVIALVLAVVFVAAVLAGAKILVNRTVYTDVTMGPVDAPDASSPACGSIIDALPDRTADFRSVGVTDPAPAGTAAYRDSGGTELTVRCGVSVPAQYTTVSSLVSHGGTDWLRVDDATEGSELSTWYSLSGTPVVAVTGEASGSSPLDTRVDLDKIGRAVAGHTDGDAPQAGEMPLAGLSTTDTASCGPFADALPDSFGDYRRIRETTASSGRTPVGTALDGAAVWTAPGAEPVVVRCGVGMPESYAPGAQLAQVNEVPWFEDTALASGSTAGVWYALGYGATVAVSLPLGVGDAVLPQISGIIVDTMPRTGE